jgi:ubiquitin-protein ligase
MADVKKTQNNLDPGAVFITKPAMKRIISDVKELRQHPLTEHGIYYEHDDTDILKGRALIIGPRDTPYENGFYLFKFKFPGDYPHAPPILEFCTGDGKTRFNPNLYRTGKVCLSILNTWKGDQWSACQTISSILLAVCTVFNENPLLNEPGVTKDHRDFRNYTEIIRYKNIKVAILDMLKDEGTLAKNEEEEEEEEEDVGVGVGVGDVVKEKKGGSKGGKNGTKNGSKGLKNGSKGLKNGGEGLKNGGEGAEPPAEPPAEFASFRPIMLNHFHKEKNTIKAKIQTLMQKFDIKVMNTGVYQLSVCINYPGLLEKLDKLLLLLS